MMSLDRTSIRRISLFCIIMQSIGIRFFSGFGFLMILMIIILNCKFINRLRISHPGLLCAIIGAIMLIGCIKGLGITALLNIFLTIAAVILFLQNYNNNNLNFISDIMPVLWFFCIYGFISWSILLILPGIFREVNMGLNYYTFLYILINNVPQEESFPRLSSLLWEPGCTQFIFNFLLIILITQKENKLKIFFVVILVLLTRSTTGYINLVLVAILYVKINKISLTKALIGGVFVFSIGLYSLISDNITDKVANTSGIIRTRDMYVGYELTKRHPLIGVDTQNLEENSEAQRLEDEVWGNSSVWTRQFGYFAGGYTNGLMGVFMDYGVFLALILYWFTLKAPIIRNNRNKINPSCFYFVYFCSLIGEPISRTTLFFMFSFSYLVNYNMRIAQINNNNEKRLFPIEISTSV